jgi:hypothetical protein
MDAAKDALGLDNLLLAKTLGLFAAVVAAPVVLVGAAGWLGRRWSRDPGTTAEAATRFSYALVPLGFGMWLAHYCFHFLSAPGSVVPVAQRLALDAGWAGLGEPAWVCACCLEVGDWLLRLEIVFLDLGLLASLYLGYRIALERRPRLPQALRALAPWAALMVMLFAFGVWILFQPMEMRGLM